MRPKISVLICAHNEEKYISTAIESVSRERNLDLEIVVVDDRSIDGTSNVISDLASKDSRIKIITRVDVASEADPENGYYYMVNHGYGGQTDALNLGLKFCNGRYIARLDADDVCVEGRLLKQLQFMENNPEVSFLGGSALRVDFRGRVFGKYHSRKISHDKIVNNLKKFKAFCAHSSWFVKREVYDELKGYHEYGYRAEDFDFMLRASELSWVKFAFITEPIIYLRMQNDRLSTSASTIPLEHAIGAAVRNQLRVECIVVTSQVEIKICELVKASVLREGMLKDLVSYRALVNVFIALKTHKIHRAIYYFLISLKNRPSMIINPAYLSEKKYLISQNIYQEIKGGM